MNTDWCPPPCPKCGKPSMEHRFYSIGDHRNGWYCSKCNAGGFQLGTKEEALNRVNTEAAAARFAIALINK